MSLIASPPEILHNVLKAVEPRDLATLSRCCRDLHDFIYRNRQLFKELYLQRLDDPQHSLTNSEPDWEDGLHKLVRLQTILEHDENEKKREHFQFVAQTVAEFLLAAAPGKSSLNVALLSNLFEDEQNREFVFCNSSLFQRDRGISCLEATLSPSERQWSAKLHCLYGVPIEATGRTRSSRTYPYACSKVYDLRNYTQNSLWGPFADDGSQNTDWEKVEAIMIVIGHNLRLFGDRTGNGVYGSIWAEPFAGAVPNSYTSLSVPRVDELKPGLDDQDPFGVTGTYMRAVCFLDFTEFFAYNFAFEQPPSGEPRPPLDTTEAIRIILMEIRVTKIEEPGKDDNPRFPIVQFTGISRSTHEFWDPNANSNIRGSVRLTREGEVRWTSISVFQGEERWRSEGIQVGGIRSARGVLGHWFDKDYDVHGPAGPTAFWKISDDINLEYEDMFDIL